MKKILVIDNNRESLDLVEALLKHNNFEVLAKTNGDNINEVVDEFKPNLILLDVRMPNKSGIDICKDLKVSYKLPIILFSISADKKISLEVSGASDFLQKPFNMYELVDMIKLHLNSPV